MILYSKNDFQQSLVYTETTRPAAKTYPTRHERMQFFWLRNSKATVEMSVTTTTVTSHLYFV